MPVPYALSLRPGATIAGSDEVSTLIVQNRRSATGSRALRGYASAATGTTVGINGRSDSSSDGAKGVFGYAGAVSGQTYGVSGESLSTSGRGVFGRASATSGGTYGVYGESHSNSTWASGVHGHATASNSQTISVYGRTESNTVGARGVFGYATATSGETLGVYGLNASSSDGAKGVYGYASADSGTTYGVYGKSESGYGGYFVGDNGVYGEGWLGVIGKASSFGSGVKGEGNLGSYGVWAVNPDSYVALYVEGSGGADYIAFIDGNTRVTGDLVVNGYLNLPTISGSGPPTEDCNETSERGRTIMRIDTGTLYICANSGWVGK